MKVVSANEAMLIMCITNQELISAKFNRRESAVPSTGMASLRTRSAKNKYSTRISLTMVQVALGGIAALQVVPAEVVGTSSTGKGHTAADTVVGPGPYTHMADNNADTGPEDVEEP
ncbi:hypothetical protein MUK42_33236 [Musa troglodytarum]|uniref:Uncharacterized protein n=1 Tax=Musa troglodytarum TaxID=320322 RepID=A0A9E7EVE3_9LILI|nr:hypothetical protein MUK42_33236 [Musa troglodytarum]